MADLGEVLKRFLTRISMEDVLAALLTFLICLLVTRLFLKLVRRILNKTRLEARIRRYVLLGVTLAAEDILGNMAGGLVLLSSHLFSIGDYIESGGVAGTVDEIGLNYTKLITPDGLSALLPNKELAASKVTNYTLLGRRRIAWKMRASYQAPTEAVKAACWQAIRKTENLLDDPLPAVYVTGYTESAVEYTVYCWATAADFWVTQFALAENLREAFTSNGIEIPFRQVDVHMTENTR